MAPHAWAASSAVRVDNGISTISTLKPNLLAALKTQAVLSPCFIIFVHLLPVINTLLFSWDCLII